MRNLPQIKAMDLKIGTRLLCGVVVHLANDRHNWSVDYMVQTTDGKRNMRSAKLGHFLTLDVG
jgi:hypothetical protein